MHNILSSDTEQTSCVERWDLPCAVVCHHLWSLIQWTENCPDNYIEINNRIQLWSHLTSSSSLSLRRWLITIFSNCWYDCVCMFIYSWVKHRALLWLLPCFLPPVMITRFNFILSHNSNFKSLGFHTWSTSFIFRNPIKTFVLIVSYPVTPLC